MIELIYILILDLLFIGAGMQILRWFGFKSTGFAGDACLGFALGGAVMSVIMYVLSFFRVLYPTLIYLVVALFLLPTVFQFGFIMNGLRKTISSINKKSAKKYNLANGLWFYLILLLTAFSFFFSLIGALSPTTDTDGLGYHLAMPKIYLQNNGFVSFPIVVSNWPMTIEMLYMLAIFIKNDVLAKLLHFTFGVMAALSIYLLAKQFWGRLTGMLAALLFLGIPMVGIEAGIAYIDLAFAFYFVVSLYAFLTWMKSGKTRWLLLSAVFTGITASTKFNGPIILTIFLLYGIFYSIKKYGAVKTFSYGAILLLISFSFTGLWYLKNLLLTGNPIIPFGGSLFPTADWNQENSLAYLKGIGSKDTSLGNLLFLPLKLTVSSWGHYQEIAFLGPLLLGLIPLVLLTKSRKKEISFFIFACIFYYIVWFFTSQQARLLLPVFSLLCILGAVGWRHSDYISIKSKKAIGWVFVIVVLLNIPIQIAYHGKAFGVVFGLEKKEEYLSRLLPAWEAFEWINKNLGKKDRVLLIGAVHGYYLDTPYIWGERDMQGAIDFESEYRNVKMQIKGRGINYVLIDENNNDHPNARRWMQQAKEEGLLDGVFEGNKVSVYRYKKN